MTAMRPAFEEILRSSKPARDKFLSRLFGLFSEDIVRYWCNCPQAAYEDLGRPTLKVPGASRGPTLDVTLCNRATGKLFFAEMKSKLEFENYRYLRLETALQVQHHHVPSGAPTAFKRFVRLIKDPSCINVFVAGKSVTVFGTILSWGAISPDGVTSTLSEYGFADVLSVESMLDDLARWGTADWSERLNQIRDWSNELLDDLNRT